MSGDSVDALERRVASLRWTTALVLAGFLINAGLIVLVVAAIAGSIVVSLISVGAMVVVVCCAALFIDTFLTHATDARPLLRDEYPWLIPIVHDLSVRAGIPPPAGLISSDEAMNAYATGIGRRSQIVFTRGVLEELPRNEVETIAAHEVAHLANRDIRLAEWTEALFFWVSAVGAILMFAGDLLWGLAKGASATGDDAIGVAAAKIFAFIAGMFAVVVWTVTVVWSSFALALRAALSRQREHLADATAVALTGRPHDFASALTHSAEDPYLRHGASRVRHVTILSPILDAGWSDRLYSTHPSTADRIRAVTALPEDEAISLADEDWRGLGSAALFVPAGAVLVLTFLAILVPLATSGGGSSSVGGTTYVAPSSGGSSRLPTSSGLSTQPSSIATVFGSSATATPIATSVPTATPTPTPTPTPAPPTATPTPPTGQTAYGQTQSGTIATAGALQRWQFNGKAGDIITIRATQTGGASLAPDLVLLDPSGAEATSAGGCPREARILNYKLKFTGAYVIRVAGGCVSMGGFELSLTVKPPPQAIAYGGSGSGQIPLADDYTLFTFTGAVGDVVTIRMTQGGGASIAPDLVLLDPSAAQAITAGGCPREARILNYTLIFAGTYTIRASGGCGSTGAFSLSLARKDPPQAITFGTTTSGEIPLAGDYQLFRFNGNAGDPVTLLVTRAGGGSLAPGLVLIDPSGARERDVGGCPSEARLSNYPLRFSGTYAIRVEGGCGTTGGFSLTLSRQ